jgi:hypothetical protein
MKVSIECYDHSTRAAGLVENVAVFRPGHADLASMDGIEAGITQKSGGRTRQSLI